MANYAHFLRRSTELQYIKNVLGELDREVNRFLKLTDHFILSGTALQLDSQKMLEIDRGLNQLETLCLDFKEQVRRKSKVKVKHWERPNLSGQAGDIIGERRKINRKLDQTRHRIRQIRSTLSALHISGQGLALEQTGQQIGNLVDFSADQPQLQPGGELVLAITFMLAFFTTLKDR